MTLLTDTIRKSPESAEVLSEYAAALYERGNSALAIEQMTRSLELRPKHEISLLKLSQYLAEQKRYGEAIDSLKEAVVLHPEYDVAWINLAKTYTEKGDWT
jgi:predicted Zn-dependent protease